MLDVNRVYDLSSPETSPASPAFGRGASSLIEGETMKLLCKWLVCLLSLVVTGTPLWAKETNRVVILPFSVHSAENIDYVRQGIGDMLASRISVNEKIEVESRDTVLTAIKDSGVKEPALRTWMR
jgi:hypothetical protein